MIITIAGSGIAGLGLAAVMLAGCGGSHKVEVGSAHSFAPLLRGNDGHGLNEWRCFASEAATKAWWAAEKPDLLSGDGNPDEKRERLENQAVLELGVDTVQIVAADGQIVNVRIVSTHADAAPDVPYDRLRDAAGRVGKKCFTIDDGNLFND